MALFTTCSSTSSLGEASIHNLYGNFIENQLEAVMNELEQLEKDYALVKARGGRMELLKKIGSTDSSVKG